LAVAFGEIDVGLESGDVSKMDGPAFHRADELLNDIERENLLFDMKMDAEPLDASVSDEVNLLLSRRHDWTERQLETVRAYREHETQRDVAESLGVTPQAVSKTLNEAEWPMIETIEGRLRSTLDELERRTAGESTR
jgi:DNA-binding XRE family transcriptional regulator